MVQSHQMWYVSSYSASDTRPKTNTCSQYRAKDKPWYRLGHGIVLAYIAIGWLSSLLFLFLLRRENAKRNAGQRDEVIKGVDNPSASGKNGTYESVEQAREEKGDEWSGFRYTM